ncbi:MAG: lytic transglycosylase domain-containing protein [Firmicutes bacterium]|nr:lytic transglycosylase domain-containing protein [Bacillota bacterium]
MAQVGAASVQALVRAGRAAEAARRAASHLRQAAAAARRAAQGAAAARAAVARARAREAVWVARIARDRQSAEAAVARLAARARGLRRALAALVALARRGSGGTAGLYALVAAVARAYGLDPTLVWAVVMVESGGDPTATSATGAQGLMQLEPATAAALGVRNPYDARANVRGGTAYLAFLVRRYRGDLALALAAYTLGPAAVPVNGPVPAAARSYVSRVLALRRGSAPAPAG